jgi:hypothetical protein
MVLIEHMIDTVDFNVVCFYSEKFSLDDKEKV